MKVAVSFAVHAGNLKQRNSSTFSSCELLPRRKISIKRFLRNSWGHPLKGRELRHGVVANSHWTNGVTICPAADFLLHHGMQEPTPFFRVRFFLFELNNFWVTLPLTKKKKTRNGQNCHFVNCIASLHMRLLLGFFPTAFHRDRNGNQEQQFSIEVNNILILRYAFITSLRLSSNPANWQVLAHRLAQCHSRNTCAQRNSQQL